MPEYRKGDRVRFSVEGIVQDVSSSSGAVQLNGIYFGHQTDLDAGGKLELLERAKPKVDDFVQPKDFDSLPVGTLLSASHGLKDSDLGTTVPHFVKVTNDYPGHEKFSWRAIRGDIQYTDANDFGGYFQILYIPD